jgi:protein O-mannosyl-transferase
MLVNTQEQRENSSYRRVSWLPGRYIDVQILLFLGLIVFVLFANSLSNGFVYDDHLVIEQNTALRDWNYFSTAFTHSFSYDVTAINYNNVSIDYYRPFTRMLFALSYQAFGLDTKYWHLLDVVLFLGVVSLAYIIIKQLLGNRMIAGFGAMLFGVHPIHSESVAWPDGMVDTLHALFFFAAFALYLRMQSETNKRSRQIFLFGSMMLAIGALFSKETAFCFPILIAFYHFIYTKADFGRRILASFRASIPFLFVVIGYFLLRYFAYGNFVRITTKMTLSTLILTLPGIISEYIRMLAIPIGLSVLHPVPIVSSILSLRFWLPMLLLSAAALFIWRRASSHTTFISGWIFVTMLPVLNVGIFPPDRIVQDRYAFLPSLGFCALVGMGFWVLFERSSNNLPARRILFVAIAIIMIALSGLTVRQNTYWHDDLALWTRAFSLYPNLDVTQCGYAGSLLAAGKQEEAAMRYQFILEQKNGNSVCSCQGLGLYYANKGDLDQSINFYEKSIKLPGGDKSPLTFMRLALVYSRKGENDKAIEILSRAITANPDFRDGREVLDELIEFRNRSKRRN